MEMEHINENLIKVLIRQEDLEERGIDFLDLVGDQKTIERFFYSILEEVDVDKHFQESEAVTFQVMPNKEGLELYISRTNFDEMDEIWEDELTKHLIERKREMNENEANKDDNKKEKTILDLFENEESIQETEDVKSVEGEIIKFADLEDFLKLSREVTTDLIHADFYHMNSNYYLVINYVDSSIVEEYAYNKLLTMFEYGEKVKVTEAILQEHGDMLRSKDALKYFGENF
ncbi:adaptor protein MecA [Aerococcaceae bacterium INB8]|uniref:Adaptor protein MecA n=1 Tax=Ruoffia halotolerans TaxID=2748684 RepID=A0A839A3C2_9LACT|nr:adaptor protein MecA [Ruoffia halotolerans]MBA5728185.1 adaptor protein MecA [Ruoffia halotolerans]